MTPNPYSGKLIVFEGLDGSGQTSQAKLLGKWFWEKRSERIYYTKEPSNGPVGSVIKLVLSHRLVRADQRKECLAFDETTMALFFAADRDDHLNNEIIPKLENGIHVISDRYYLSALAYQSVVLEYDWIMAINKHALQPDLTIFLDVPPEICLKRMQAERWNSEFYENPGTLEKAYKNFLESIPRLQRKGERIEIIDGTQSLEDVHKAVVNSITTLFV